MDALIEARMDAAVLCDDCGYDLRGLPADSRCPECGGEQPAPLRARSMVAAHSRGHLSWMRCIAAGLVLLIGCSVASFQVALVMRGDSHVAVAMNAPCPKIWMGPMLQRQLGGQPGPWGVQAWMAAFGGVAAVWLLTWRRANNAPGALASPAGLARWSAALGIGGAMGALLAVSTPYSYIWVGGNETLQMLTILMLIEVPVNFLLYRHLHLLAKETDPRAAALLKPSVLLVPAAALVGGLSLLIPWTFGQSWPAGWLAAYSIVTAAMVVIGVVASLGVLRLAAVIGSSAIVHWLHPWRAMCRASLRHAAAARWIRRNARRCAVVIGLGLWFWVTLTSTKNSIGIYPSRKGLANDLPMVGFLGPKLTVAQLHTTTYWERPQGFFVTAPLFTSLLATWLMTTRLHRQDSRLRLTARYVPLALAAAALVAVRSFMPAETSRSLIAAGLVAGVEAPCTLLIYLYLAHLAKQLPLARHLRWVAVLSALLLIVPLAAYPLARPLAGWNNSLAVGMIAAVYMCISLSITFIAGTALVRLMWGLIDRQDPINPRSCTAARWHAAGA